MKWGHTYEIVGPERLLYQVIAWVIWQSSPIDKYLKHILINGGGFGGDPGWEIEHIPESTGHGHYRVWADSQMSGIQPDEMSYDLVTVHRAIKQSLLAFGTAYPEKLNEVNEIIKRYRL
jgi:hypothetical protein